MSPILAALLLSNAALAEAPMPDEVVPDAAAPRPVQEVATTPPPAQDATETRGLTTGAATHSAAARILPVDARLEAYDQFRAMYETSRFAEALPLAQRVAELSDTDEYRNDLPVAYINLGATQFRLNDFQAAEASYRKSLDLLESSQGISSPRMIVPLAGLGAVYAALDQHALAVEQFDRALAVSRRAEGLFNVAQLPLIEQVVDSRSALGDYGGVERERLYALKVLEQQYGFDDPRTSPAVMRLASFYESVSEFVAARALYLRMRDISMKESGGFNALAVRSLVAIARTHRLQFTIDPDSLDDDVPVRDPITGELVGRVYRTIRVPAPAADRAGLKSVALALEVLRATADPPQQLLAETLIELGDWYQATRRPNSAMPYYAEASIVHASDPASGQANALLAPRMIFYRAPVASKRGVGSVTGKIVVRTTVFSFLVTATGETRAISVVTSDMSEGQLAQARRALDRAIYSPRFEGGKPVATEGVRFTSDWYEQQPIETPSTTEC